MLGLQHKAKWQQQHDGRTPQLYKTSPQLAPKVDTPACLQSNHRVKDKISRELVRKLGSPALPVRERDKTVKLCLKLKTVKVRR